MGPISTDVKYMTYLGKPVKSVSLWTLWICATGMFRGFDVKGEGLKKFYGIEDTIMVARKCGFRSENEIKKLQFRF